jgi:Protein of unknown function (DUF3616)
VPLDSSGKPVEKQGDLTVARLQGDARGNVLTEALKKDDHIGLFVPRVLPDGTVEGVPSKDNGLDVEGLAVSGKCSLVSEDRFCVAGPWSSNSR